MSSAAIRSMICWLSCVGSSIAGFLPTLDVARSARPPEEGAARGLANLDRVLEATRKGPTAQLPAPDCSTTFEDQGIATSTGGRTPIFSPERAARQGDRRLLS